MTGRGSDLEMDLSEKILGLLSKSKTGSLDSVELAKALNVDYQKVVGAIKSLEALGDYVQTQTQTQNKWELTGRNQKIRVLCSIPFKFASVCV